MDFPGRLIVAVLVVIMITYMPLQYLAQSNNENIDFMVASKTEELTDTIRDKGYIDIPMYEDFVNFLDATGEIYDIAMEDIHPVTGEEIYSYGIPESMDEKYTSADNSPFSFVGNVLNTNMNTPGSAPGLALLSDLKINKTASVNSRENTITLFAIHEHTAACYNGDKHTHSTSCYTSTPVYHKHTGSETSGGGCYGKAIYHVHSSSCYGYVTCGGSLSYSVTRTGTYNCSHCGTKVSGTSVIETCSKCGSSWSRFYYSCGHIDTRYSSCPNMINTLTCTTSTTTPISYDLNCGKDEWTVEYYNSTLTCGKSEGYYYNASGQLVSPTCNTVVTSIAATNPNQTITQGDDIIKTVTATYLDGHTGAVTCTVSGFNTNLVGTQTVTLTYSGTVDNAKTTGTKICTITVVVKSAKSLTSITVTPATQTVYLNGSPSFTVKANYSDSTSTILTAAQYTVTGFNAAVTGSQTVTISYTDTGVTKTATATVFVNSLSSLTVTPATQTVSINGTPTFTVKANFLDGTSTTLTSGQYSISGYNSTTPGSQTVTISYTDRGVTKTATATVFVNSLTSITVAPASQTIARLGTPTFNVTAYYGNGTNKALTAGQYTISGFNSSATGAQTVTVSFMEGGITKTATATVNVNGLTSISPSPSIITVERYTNQMSLSFSLTATFLYGGNKTITSGYTISGYSPSVLGQQNITISYSENGITKTASAKVNVTVLHKVCPRCNNTYSLNTDDSDPGCPVCKTLVTGIVVTPDNVEVTQGGGLPITVQAIYNDNSKSTVTGWTSNFVSSRLGLQIVTISYSGFAANITVWVNETNKTCPICHGQYPTSLSRCPVCSENVTMITVAPSTVTVNQNSPLNITVTAYYADGISGTVTDWSIDRGTSQAGNFTATVTYKNASNTITLNVISLTSVVCPTCGLVYEPSKNPKGCPVCSSTISSIEAYLASGSNLVQYGSIPSIAVVLIFRDQHRELTTDGYIINNYDSTRLGAQTITIQYNGFSTTLDIVVVNALASITCPKGHIYYLNEDGSDPGCPYCTMSQSLDNVYYYDISYESDILDSLYKNGIYYFKKGNYITITVTKRDLSLLTRIQKTFFKTTLLGRRKKYTYGGGVY